MQCIFYIPLADFLYNCLLKLLANKSSNIATKIVCPAAACNLLGIYTYINCKHGLKNGSM